MSEFNICVHTYLKSTCVTLCSFTVIIVLYVRKKALSTLAPFSLIVNQKYKNNKQAQQNVHERFRLCIFSVVMKMRVLFGAKALITAFS